MSARNKIEKYNLGPEILRMDALPGMTTYRIAEILTEQLAGADSINQSMVSRWLKAEREERGQHNRAVVHERLAAEVLPDLDTLNEVKGWLLAIFRNQPELPPLDAQWEKDAEIKDLVERIRKDHKEGGGYDLKLRMDAAMKTVKVVEVKLKHSGILEDPLRPKALDDLTDEELKERLQKIGS